MVWWEDEDKIKEYEADERLETCMKYFVISASGSCIALIALLSTNMLRNQIDCSAIMPAIVAVFVIQIAIMLIFGIMVYIAKLLQISVYEKNSKNNQ